MRVVHVVAGLLYNETVGDMLMGLRKPGKKRPDLWELPGGKVEDGESPRTALAREWQEELGAKIDVRVQIASASFDWNGLCVVDLYHVVRVGATARMPVLQPLDHAELRWATPDHALDHLPCSPAFYVHYPWIKRWQGAL